MLQANTHQNMSFTGTKNRCVYLFVIVNEYMYLNLPWIYVWFFKSNIKLLDAYYNSISICSSITANAAFIALLAADLGIGNPTTYKSWAMSQIHYMLGDNKLDMSYLIGYGDKYPQNPHHRSRYMYNVIIFYFVLLCLIETSYEAFEIMQDVQ